MAPDNAAENLAGQPFRSVYVGVSTDVRLGLPVFTFTDQKVFTGPVGSNTENLFPALAVDDFAFVYAVWSDNTNIFFSSSSDQGTTWTPAIQVNSAPTVGNANVFPWIAADAFGHVGIVWFGDDRVGNSNDTAMLAPCPSGSTTCMQNWANWSVYIAESINANSATPVFTQSAISDHIIHRGTVSTGGLGGGANRNLGDLFQIALDPQHQANVAFSDDHKLSPVTVSGHTGNDDPQARRLIRANFTHQLMANPNIVTTATCAGPPPPEVGNKITGGGRLGSPVNFGFIAKDTPLNGALEYQDDSFGTSGLKVHSSNGIDSITFSGNCASFTGDARVNQQPGYRFRVSACDNAEPGAGKDTFSLSVTGPNNFSYSNGGVITDGNIQIHNQ